MVNKRGVVEVQFHWIFILIVGAFILTFFIGIALWYKEKADVRLQADVLSKLGNILKKSSQISAASKAHQLPDLDLTFRCDPEACNDYGCTSSLEIGKSGLNFPIDTEVIFAPRKIKANNLITWTQSWNAPFKVTNMLYITTSQYQYIVVKPASPSSTDIAQQLYDKLKESTYITVQLVENNALDQFIEVPNVEYKYIVFNNPSLSSLQDKKYLLINGDLTSGTVTFKDSMLLLPYLGLPSLLGAVFSDDANFYRCTMNKAIAQFKLVSVIYLEKAKRLYEFYNLTTTRKSCTFYYDQQTSQKILSNFKDTLILPPIDSINTLQRYNEKALLSCRELY